MPTVLNYVDHSWFVIGELFIFHFKLLGPFIVFNLRSFYFFFLFLADSWPKICLLQFLKRLFNLYFLLLWLPMGVGNNGINLIVFWLNWVISQLSFFLSIICFSEFTLLYFIWWLWAIQVLEGTSLPYRSAINCFPCMFCCF